MDEEEKPFDCYQPKQAANPRGLCCVIANFCAENYIYRIDQQIYAKDRDVKMIQEFFETTLGYRYEEFINNTKEGFIKALNWIKSFLSSPDNETIDRLFLFVLSHGSEKGIHTCQNNGEEYETINGEDQIVPVEMITSFFDHRNIPSLKDQPKCIFIQACRGTSEDIDIAVKKEDQECICNGETKAPTPSSYLKETEDNVPEVQGERNIEDDSDDSDSDVPEGLEETEVFLRTPRAELRPSSASILVCFACQKWNVSYVSPSEGPYFIAKLINTLKEHHKYQHLLDMVVEVTRKFVKPISHGGYQRSLIFPYDSSYQAELSQGKDLPDVPFSVHATSPRNTKGEVKEFGSHLGIIIEKSKKIDNRLSLLLHCTLKYKGSNAQMEDTLPIQKIEDEFLKDGYFEIDNSKNSLLLNGICTIGFGKVTTDDKTIVSIEKEVIPCPQDSTYHIVYENGEKAGEFINRKECRIWKHSTTGDDKRLVAVGQLTIEKKVKIPHVKIDLYQLPIFESTLTKKFYLAEPPKFPDQDTLDGNIRRGMTTAGGSSENEDVPRSSVPGNLGAKIEKLNKMLSNLNVRSSRKDYESDRFCATLVDDLRAIELEDIAKYRKIKGEINKIVFK